MAEELQKIFRQGGDNGKELKEKIFNGSGGFFGFFTDKRPVLILLNSQGKNGAFITRSLTVDINSPSFLSIFDHTSSSMKPVTFTRVLAHELAHAVMRTPEHGLFGASTVNFTDGIMSGINGRQRKTYNGCNSNINVCNGIPE